MQQRAQGVHRAVSKATLCSVGVKIEIVCLKVHR